MLRLHRRAAQFGLVVILIVLVSGVIWRQTAKAGTAAQPPFGAQWSFAVKFVCGLQRPTGDQAGEPPVKPGNYATEINIHNFTYQTAAAVVVKKLLILAGTSAAGAPFALREPQLARPRVVARVALPADTATMDDCNAIWKLAGLPPGALTIGYLVLLSSVDLDVDAVYTASVPGLPGTTASGIAEDVVLVTGKRLLP
jgi:hypothetical protein